MARDRGKQFEDKLKKDWEKSLPSSFILRIPDQVSMYKNTSENICDFMMYNEPKLFLVEVKTVEGNTFSIQTESKEIAGKMTPFRQYYKLLKYKDYKGVFPGVMIWFQKHDKVVWFPIDSIEKMINDGKKSINIKMLKEQEYFMLDIPSVKKRVFMDSDYSVMMSLRKD